MIPEYTIVCGVDFDHLWNLEEVWPTWKRYKPSLLDHPMIIFTDNEVGEIAVRSLVDHPNLEIYRWPPEDVEYEDKIPMKTGTELEQYEAMWESSQRYKMLAGFCYIPSYHVKTEYWLKLDLSVYATGQADWIDPKWFKNEPAIISHRWGYTKPANQMIILDEWIEDHRKELDCLLLKEPSLDLIPELNSSRIVHKRIISWCAFFNTQFTCSVMKATKRICGEGKLPVKSQDGFLWYMAKRGGWKIVRTNMKKRGWDHRPTRPFSMAVLRG